MVRALTLLVLLGLSVALALWLARVGGSVEVRVGDAWIGVAMPVALLGLAALAALLLASASAVGWLRRLPARFRARRAGRDRAEGDAALTRALVALAAGTPDAARVEIGRARALLGDSAQTLLLTAEAERLGGREEAATEAFRALADRADSRFLGLRGLLRQAMAAEDWPEAKRLAAEAEQAQPGTTWLREERGRLALRTRDWREALALAPPDVPRAPLALAAALQEANPARAAGLEREAFEADRGFVPAALAHARRLAAEGSPRRARAAIEQAWAATPHPELAELHLAGEAQPLERVKLADALAGVAPDHAESRLLVARVALAAGLTGRARQSLDALVASGEADRRAFLLLAETELAEGGDTPAAREAHGRQLRLATAARAEPRWRCAECGTEYAAWQPVCDACGAMGRIEWVSPPPVARTPTTLPEDRAAAA